MKTKMQKYLSRSEFEPVLTASATNEIGSIFTMNTHVKSSILEIDDQEIESLIRDKILITLGDIKSLQWNIKQN